MRKRIYGVMYDTATASLIADTESMTGLTMYEKAVSHENQHIIAIRTAEWGQGPKLPPSVNSVDRMDHIKQFFGIERPYIKGYNCFFLAFDNLQFFLMTTIFPWRKGNDWFVLKQIL